MAMLMSTTQNIARHPLISTRVSSVDLLARLEAGWLDDPSSLMDLTTVCRHQLLFESVEISGYIPICILILRRK